MSPQQARDIAQLLIAAADKAEAEALDQVDILPDLRAMDDAARAELEAAINAAESKPND
jgi:hypothetical protein